MLPMRQKGFHFLFNKNQGPHRVKLPRMSNDTIQGDTSELQKPTVDMPVQKVAAVAAHQLLELSKPNFAGGSTGWPKWSWKSFC